MSEEGSKSSMEPMPWHGFGKKVTSIVAEQGHCVMLVSDEPKCKGAKPAWDVHSTRWGARPMHTSTLVFPTQDNSDYLSSHKKDFSANRRVQPGDRPQPYPSQHTSKVTIPHRNCEDPMPWTTSHRYTYQSMDTEAPSKIHFPSVLNRTNMTRGGGVKSAIVLPTTRGHPLSQYVSVHSKLGLVLGPGVQREAPIRRAYNVITGEDIGPAWKPNNKRVSFKRPEDAPLIG